MTAHLATLRFSTKQWLYPKPLHNLSKIQVNYFSIRSSAFQILTIANLKAVLGKSACSR